MITTLAILLLGVGFSGALQAKAPQTILWKGKGTLYSKDRKIVDEYDLSVENKDLPTGVTNSRARITPQKGEALIKTCSIKKSGEGWSLDCDDGKGGMYCFAHGTCTMYVSAENNVAFATTLVFDGDNKMRLLRTELHNGEAVRFFSESLEKQSIN